MKKILLIFVAVIGFGIMANAQDVILKQDGSELKTKVLEITDQQIKYKEFDFQSGPTRNINISEVFMITYENGKKEVFNKTTEKEDTSIPKAVWLSDKEWNEVAATMKINSNEKNDVSPPESPIVIKDELKNEFYRIGADDRKMVNFFRKNNFMSYYNDFEFACRMRETGRGLLIGGLTMMGFGTAFMIVGLLPQAEAPWVAIVGYGFISVGEILTIVSIPVSAVAGAKKRAIKNDFVREHLSIYTNPHQPTLNFGCTGNAIGISLKF